MFLLRGENANVWLNQTSANALQLSFRLCRDVLYCHARPFSPSNNDNRLSLGQKRDD